jgi:hypothetical protein
VVAIIIMPLLPLLVEAARNNLQIKGENLLLTTAVLAVGFGFSSESNLFRASYALLFFFAIGLDFHPEAQGRAEPLAVETVQGNAWLFAHPGYFVIAVCGLHAIERLDWHVAKKRRFPDWLR